MTFDHIPHRLVSQKQLEMGDFNTKEDSVDSIPEETVKKQYGVDLSEKPRITLTRFQVIKVNTSIILTQFHGSTNDEFILKMHSLTFRIKATIEYEYSEVAK